MMKKTFIALLLSLLLALAFVPVASALDLDLVEDLAGVLTYEELDELLWLAEEISKDHRCDVIIVTMQEMPDGDNAYEFARFVFRNYNYGYGADRSGVMLFLSVAERDFALIANGFGNTAFTDHGKDVMLDKHILPLLGENKYFEAFSAYLNKADEFLQMARDGKPFDEADSGSIIFKLAVTILLPLLVAFIVCSMWKKQMKTAVTAKTASYYIPDGGFRLTGQVDMFLYKTRTKTKIQKTSSSSGGGGTTRDSKGFSGRSGKF